MKKQVTPIIKDMPSLRFLLILLSIFTVSASFAAEAVSVDRVKFNSLRDDWVQMEIQISCDGNPAQDAKNPRYLEDVTVKAYLTYSEDGAARAFTYYMSEVEIMIMEKGETYNVYFYLPGLIVERDRLKTEPDFYYVELSIGDTPLEPQRDAMSSSITSASMLENMKGKAMAEGEANADILMPIYYAPADNRGRVDDLPLMYRRDPKQ